VSRQKRVKKNLPKVTEVDRQQMEDVYAIRPIFATGVYLTPILQEKSTLVRLTFAEFNHSLSKNTPCAAVVTSIEDVQNIYNAMTVFLQQMRTMGRIS